MVSTVDRYGRSKANSFEIFVGRLKRRKVATLVDLGDVDYRILLDHLNDEYEGIGFERQRYIMYRPADTTHSLERRIVKGQLAFETTLYMQNKAGYPVLKLVVCSEDGEKWPA